MRGQISISPYPSRPGTPWKVDVPASIAGKRTRRFFSSESTARLWAEAQGAKAVEVGFAAFRPVDEGKSVSVVVKAYKGRPGAPAEKSYHERAARGIYDALERKFGSRGMDGIEPLELERWIWSQGSSETTKAKYFRYCRSLWWWAWRKRLIENNVIERVDSPRALSGRNVLSPDQMRALLALDVPDWLEMFFVMSGFLGLRTEELLAMEWSDLDFRDKQAHVRPGVQKDSGGWDERYVDFTPPILRRCKGWAKNSGKIIAIEYGTFRKARVKAAEAIGLDGWPRNCLRHSFASYHLADCGDAGKTAHQMGHTSPSMVYKTYARAVKARDAKAWWAL